MEGIRNTLDIVTENLRLGFYSQNPIIASQDHARLAGEYSWNSSQLIDVLKEKSLVWNEIRIQTGSDKQADKQWDAREDGIAEMTLRLRLKSIEKMMSALKSLVRIAETEAHNGF